MSKYPFYSMVPKDLVANAKFRADLIRMGAAGKKAATELYIMCARDLLFYVNAFCYTFDPRKTASPVIPFITYDYQDKTLDELNDAIGNHDLAIEKSRDMGASWCCLLPIEWRWHFKYMQTFLLLSRIEDLVDKTEDPKSLFWKIDFIIGKQPGWLRPKINRQKLHLLNEDTGSTIDGASTTGEAATGDRRTAILLDEFAKVENGYAMLSSTRDATKCRIFNSTPSGTGNAHYDIVQTCKHKLRLHWTLHPEKAKGLYYDAETNKPRSPWYDNECERAAHPQEIAQELDIDYLGSNYQFFDQASLAAHEKAYVRQPLWTGDVMIDEDTLEIKEWIKGDNGPLELWLELDAQGKPPKDRGFAMGVDISAGTGASNSVIAIGDRKLCEKIAQYRSANIRPDQLAKRACALGKFFKDHDDSPALLVWEANGGPGQNFGNVVIESGYRHVYYRTNEKSVTKKVTDIPGWYSTTESKAALLGDYRRALKDGTFVNHSWQAIHEARQYIFMKTGAVAHVKSSDSLDPSGARDNHGDCVIADALLNKAFRQKQVAKVQKQAESPKGSFAYRRKKWEERQKATTTW